MAQGHEGSVGERRELRLGPEHFQLGEKGEVIIQSKELDRALADADVKPGVDPLSQSEVSVGVVVSRSF
jgi:hypothetical protein